MTAPFSFDAVDVIGALNDALNDYDVPSGQIIDAFLRLCHDPAYHEADAPERASQWQSHPDARMSNAFKAVDAPIAGCRADGLCPTQDMCRDFQACCWPRPVEDVCHEMHSTDRAEIQRLESEVEQLRERVASLMLEEPSKTQGLYAAIDELQEGYDRERQRTRSGVRTPPPGFENGYVSGSVHAAVCEERDRYRASLELIDSLTAPVATPLPTKRRDES